MSAHPLLKVEHASGLSDADWQEIERLQRVYSTGGGESLSEALDSLVTSNPDRAATILSALTPSAPTAVPQNEWENNHGPEVEHMDMEEMLRQLKLLAGE